MGKTESWAIATCFSGSQFSHILGASPNPHARFPYAYERRSEEVAGCLGWHIPNRPINIDRPMLQSEIIRAVELASEEVLPIAVAASHAAQAALLVEAGLFPLGAEESAVAEFAQNARPLHGSLEPLQKTLRVFPVTKLDE